MTDQVVSSSDIQRIERGVERMNDKVDLVWSGVSELQSKFVRLETESINISKETDRNKQELEVYKTESIKKLELYKEDTDKKFNAVEEKIFMLEKNHSNLIVKLAPLFLIGTILLSVSITKIVGAVWPKEPTPQVQLLK